jgi:hypothetical protein
LFRKRSSLEAYIKKQERSSEMSRTKALISILMILILIALSGVSVWAAPGGEEPTAEPTSEPTEEPTAEPTEEPTAEPTEEPTAEPTEEPTAEPTEEPTAEPTEEPPEEEPTTEHPVASALAEFFNDILGLEDGAIMSYHEDGMGFGVIAQACWMSYGLEGDAELLDDILEAKKSGDFSSITLPDGETAKNWGQFRKAALGNEKAKKNLGAIMSGRAKQEQEQEQEQGMSATGLSGKGKDKGGKPDTPPGQLKNKKDKDKGGGPPAEPPGQAKNKDKGGGKKK